MIDPYILQPDDPLLAPAGAAIDGDLLEQLIRRQVEPGSSDRKRRARFVHDIYENRYEHHILAEIRQQQNSRSIRETMAKVLDAVRNDARDVLEQVAVTWKNGAERHLGQDGDDDDLERSSQEEALRVLADEADFDALCIEVNHLAWLQGPQFLVPVVRNGELRADHIGPHVYDIVQDVNDPLGMPVALAWHLSTHTTTAGPEHHVHVLDAVSLRRFVVHNGVTKQADRTDHNLGRLPAACLRFSRPKAGDDWYRIDEHSRLTSGTIEIGVKLARMAAVRRVQCHKLLTLVGDLSSMARGQEGIGDPEEPVLADTGARTGGGRTVEVAVHDFDTPPDSAIKEILFWAQCMAEPLGGQVQADQGQIYGRVVVPPASQAEHRNKQIRPALKFERMWWSAVVAMLVAEGHRLANALPSPDAMRDRLRVNFGALSRDLEDPDKATAYEDWQLSRGQTSEVELMQRRLGGASEDEAWREIERNMANRARFNELASRSNLSTDPQGMTQTTPEANGAMGTPAREAARADDDSNAAGSVDAETPPST